jgi:hypothetical protein
MRDADLELPRQVALAVDRFARVDGPNVAALLVALEDLEIGRGLRRECIGDFECEIERARRVLWIEAFDRRTHHVAAHVTAGTERRTAAITAIEVSDQRGELRTVDVVELNSLARSHAQGAVREFVRGAIEREPLLAAETAARRRLDPGHEEVVVDLPAALASSLLLVDAKEFRDLLGFGGDRSAFLAVERVEFVRERMAFTGRGLDVEEPLARDLEMLVLGHLGGTATREIYDGRGGLLGSHGILRRLENTVSKCSTPSAIPD